MPTSEEIRLEKQLSVQKAECEKWFAKIQQINDIVQAARKHSIYIGGSKPQGFAVGGLSAPHTRSLSATKAIEKINAILHGER